MLEPYAGRFRSPLPRVAELVARLGDCLGVHLSCADLPGGAGALIDALLAADLDTVVSNLGGYSWGPGTTLEGGVDEALGTVAASSGFSLSDSHVCNNDALLQAELFHRFVAGEIEPVCDAGSSLCVAPRGYYDPATE